jgi:hypothetical protein
MSLYNIVTYVPLQEHLINLSICFFMLLSLSARKKVTKEMHPGKLSFGFAQSLGKIRPRLNSLRFTPLRQNPLFP